ncbi:OsmC family protein [Microbacterium karelineae]|uniref:OsmC family protein n=1 Tax=Microbacterium karelineae TaxID=2654283 RepID=UPI0012EAE17A|nr:OsmC family protein [Microbacterium karelineae]
MTSHRYALTTTWTGDRGTGTSAYRDYARDVTIRVEGKPELLASADRAFRGDASRWNPEDMLLAALSECHLLSYLHACTTRGVVVTQYVDAAEGALIVEGSAGRFERVVLRPRVTVADPAMIDAGLDAHHDAHEWCFIANSVSFPVEVDPIVEAG